MDIIVVYVLYILLYNIIDIIVVYFPRHSINHVKRQ